MHRKPINTDVRGWCLTQGDYARNRLYDGLETIYRIHHINSNNPRQLGHKLTGLHVKENRRLKTCAGVALYGYNRIELHPAICDPDDPVYKDRFDTFFHELAHFAAMWYFSEKGHGLMWQTCMISFGFNPKKCYNPHEFNYRGYGDRAADRLLAGVKIDL